MKVILRESEAIKIIQAAIATFRSDSISLDNVAVAIETEAPRPISICLTELLNLAKIYNGRDSSTKLEAIKGVKQYMLNRNCQVSLDDAKMFVEGIIAGKERSLNTYIP
jgi:hypothetical protein